MMNPNKPGGFAFPTAVQGPGGTGVVFGMYLRDYFAAKAMQGAIASSSDKLDFGPDLGAVWAYQVADAMLAAREKGGAK